jgi:hypothetical protein
MSNYIPTNEHFLKRYRNIRNELLNKTDKYILSDYPITLDQQMQVKIYREELREFINKNKELILAGNNEIKLPEQPDFINLNILY